MIDIRVLRVYKNSSGKQLGVKVDIDGRILTRLTLWQLRYLVGWGCRSVNFNLTKVGVQGKDCNLECLEWLTLNEMRERYEGAWVAVVDGRYKRASVLSPLRAGAVLAVVRGEEYGRRCRELINKGAVFEKMPSVSNIVLIEDSDE